jgi:hypothetical protein
LERVLEKEEKSRGPLGGVQERARALVLALQLQLKTELEELEE